MKHRTDMFRVPVVIYRGGTSKAVFIKEYDLPAESARRDRVINAIFGSPDKRQIDGLGGADPLTSKLAVIGPPSRPDADVDYDFAQVDILSPTVYFGAVCGNITAAVGPYAVEEGFVRPEDGLTRVRIHSRNIGRMIEAVVPTPGRVVKVTGDYVIDGVPGSGAHIELNWADTVGANTGDVLPTGFPRDTLEVNGMGRIEVSIVDVGNPGVFVKAADIGLLGSETPEQVDSDRELLGKCEAIAAAATAKIGKMAFLTYVAPPADYINHVTGGTVPADHADLLVRMIFLGAMHKTYAASQTNCCGAAAMIPGTVVQEIVLPAVTENGRIRLGHPAGIADVEVTAEERAGKVKFSRISVHRTARRLMEGYAFVKSEVLSTL